MHADVDGDGRRDRAGRAGRREAAGFRRYVDFVSRAVPATRCATSSTATSTRRSTCSRPNLARLAALGGFRRLAPEGRRSTCTTRGRSGCSRSRRCTPGCRRTTRSRSTPSSPTWTRSPGVFFPRGGMHAVPRALAGAAEKHGVEIRYGTTVAAVERAATAPSPCTPRTASGSPCDVVVLNPDLPVAYRELLGARAVAVRRLRYSPSCFLLLAGSTRDVRRTRAPHDLLRARPGAGCSTSCSTRPADERPVAPRHQPDARPTRRWRRTGGRSTTCSFPTPNLDAADRLARGSARATATRWCARSRRAATPGSATASRSSTSRRRWTGRPAGMERGTPFAAAHTFGQTGPFRPRQPVGRERRVRRVRARSPGVGVPMVLISGRLAAERVTARGTRALTPRPPGGRRAPAKSGWARSGGGLYARGPGLPRSIRLTLSPTTTTRVGAGLRPPARPAGLLGATAARGRRDRGRLAPAAGAAAVPGQHHPVLRGAARQPRQLAGPRPGDRGRRARAAVLARPRHRRDARRRDHRPAPALGGARAVVRAAAARTAAVQPRRLLGLTSRGSCSCPAPTRTPPGSSRCPAGSRTASTRSGRRPRRRTARSGSLSRGVVALVGNNVHLGVLCFRALALPACC